GKFIRLDIAVGPAEAAECAYIGHDLLLEIEVEADPALIAADIRHVRRAAELLGEHDRVVEAAHPAAGDETVEHDAAGLAEDLVGALHLVIDLEFVEAIELDAVRHDREIEQAAAYRPGAVIPLGGGAISIAPGVGGIIPGAGVDQRP